MHWLLRELKGTKVLRYHHIWPGIPDQFTVTPLQLEKQFAYLKENGYTTIFVSALIKAILEKRKLPPKTIVLTFDDGYRNQVEFVEPLLEKYGFCACLFLYGEKVMLGAAQGNGTKQNYLLAENVRKTDPAIFEFGLQGYSNKSFAEMNNDQIRSDILMSQQVFSAMNIPAISVLAYPGFDRVFDKSKIRQFKRIIQECGIIAAFSEENGSVSFPVKDIFELKRIEITGFDNLKKFKIKLKKGKLSLFYQ